MHDLSFHGHGPGPSAEQRLPTLPLPPLRDSRIERALRQAPLAGAAIAVALAATALLGWLLDLPILQSLDPGGVPMKFNAAIGMLACGAALLLVDAPWPAQRAAARVPAALAAVLGAATLMQYATGLDFGIDQSLMRDPLAAGGLPPGRMAPNTALNLVLLGAALLLMAGRRDRFGLQGLALAALVVAMLSGLGQAYGGVTGLGVGALDGMASITAAGFVALSVGILCARPDSGWLALFSSAGAGGHVMRSLLPIVVAVPALMGWLRVAGEDAGLFDHRLGAALVALASTAVLAALVVWSARRAESIDADRRRVEAQNARLYEQVQQQAVLLERRVRERTAQLESAVKDLEGFSYSVSHDLRAPLRAIDSFADILLQDHAGRLDDEGRRLLGVVRANTAKMSQLIDDILSFSRAGRREMALGEVDLGGLVAEVLQEQQPAAGERRIDFRIGPLPKVHADRPALRQVLVNLLANAIKFTRHRAEAVVEVTAGVADGQTVVSIRDNGAGFDPQYGHKLFGVFQRLHGPAQFEGTGIGLAIVKRIVEKHGGRVWADGRPDAGATFHFSLPRPAPGASAGESRE